MFLIIASLPQIKYAPCVRVSFVCVPVTVSVPAMQIDYSPHICYSSTQILANAKPSRAYLES